MTNGSYHPEMVKIGERMRARRQQVIRTESEIADLIGIKRERYHQWEEGRNTMPIIWLPCVAKALKVPITYFFESDEEVAAQADLNITPEEIWKFRAMQQLFGQGAEKLDSPGQAAQVLPERADRPVS